MTRPVTLYTYWRSTAAWRVRIALNLKNVAVDLVPVHLGRDGGEQHAEAYSSINPNRTVPALVLADGSAIVQSLAAIEYLDEIHPDPPILPADPVARAKARMLAQVIACDIHPINNLRVGNYMKERFSHTQDDVVEWMNHWMKLGFSAFQELVPPEAPYCCGEDLTIADLCLVPQLFNARRWGLDLTPFSRLTEIEQRCAVLPAFRDAHPDNQPDSET